MHGRPAKQIALQPPGNSRTNVPYEALQTAIAEEFGIPAERQLIARYNAKHHRWKEIKPNQTSGKGRKKRRRNNLLQAPYSLKDGTLVVVKDKSDNAAQADNFMRLV